MGDRLQKKKNQLDFYFSSFQEIFSVPYSNVKYTPYNNLRGSSEQKHYADIALEKKYSEKNFLAEAIDPEIEMSISSSDSRSQLPSIKAKKLKKIVGLPYQQEILKNEKLIKMNKVQTASNWFPGLNLAAKCEEVRTSQPIVRPASSSGPCKKDSIKARPFVTQSNTESKLETPNSNRPYSKHKRVIMKSKVKRISEAVSEKDEEGQEELREIEKFDTDQGERRKKEVRRSKIWNKGIERKSSCGKEEITGDEAAKEDKTEKKKEKKPKEEKKIEKIKSKEKKVKSSDKEETLESKEKLVKPEKTKKSLPPSVAEIVDKRRSFNLNQLLNNKNTDFKGLMQEYLRRSGLPEHSKIFILSGPYEYLRKILTSRGWIENTHTCSQAFDLKWTNSDQESDYKTLRPGQLFNHFSNNRELTTKSGLLKNLRQVMDCSTNIDEFYPRTYDLGDNTQVQEFIKDYYQTCAFNVVKKCVQGMKVKEEILRLAIKIAKKYVKDFVDQCEETDVEWEYNDDMHKRILEYSEKDEVEVETEDREEVRRKAEKLRLEIEKLFPQSRMEGWRNIWIVKPGLNARGSGVKCMQGLNNILECGVHLQARVVQKYVEEPLLINSNKFDIRQWVLVTSFEPLTVYFFNNCYLRLCQMAFTLDSLEAHRHLANYSLQKNVAKNQEETVWSLSKFCEHLKTIGKDWGEILPKIHYMVIKTLLAVKESIDSRPECFELYGFDVILDTNLVPWLLEVNLSPACAERTEWLSEMLSAMGSGIIDLVLEGTQKQPLYSIDLKPRKSLKFNRNKWVFLYKGEENPAGDCENLAFGQLEIVGEKLNVKRERIFDKRLALSKSVINIQRVFRGFRERKRIKREKDERVARVIQKVFRRKQGFERLEFQVKLVCCIKIQSFARMIIAVKKGKGLRKLKMIRFIQAHVKGTYQRNEFKLVKMKRSSLVIQKCFRTALAKAAVQQERKVKASILLIQKYWKKRFVLKNKLAAKIQKHWVCRFKKLILFSTRIQKHFRGYKARKLFQTLKLLLNKVLVVQNYLKTLVSKQHVHSKKILRASIYILQRSIQNKSFRILSYIIYSKSATTIQKNYRKYKTQQKYKPFITASLKLRSAVLKIQNHIIGFLSRSSFTLLIKHKSATLIQKVFKGFKARKFFSFLIVLNESAKLIQRAYRRFKTRRKFQMFLRIRVQENERRKRMERLKREQEIKAIMASDRLHNNGSSSRPASLKAKQQLILESKMPKIKKKGSKNKYKNEKINDSMEEVKTLPRASTQEGKKLKKGLGKDGIGNL